jgi:glycosyltransferase involved in cell wall biosynthesis
MVRAGHERVEREFAWPAIAQQTADLYSNLRR